MQYNRSQSGSEGVTQFDTEESIIGKSIRHNQSA